MQQTTNYNLNKFDSTDELESATRLGLNENADTIDTALKGIQDDIDGLTAAEVSYDNTDSGLTATDVQAALDEELGKIDILSNTYVVETGQTTTSDNAVWNYTKWSDGLIEATVVSETKTVTSSALMGGYYASITHNKLPFIRDITKASFLISTGMLGTGVTFTSSYYTGNAEYNITVWGNQNGTSARFNAYLRYYELSS